MFDIDCLLSSDEALNVSKEQLSNTAQEIEVFFKTFNIDIKIINTVTTGYSASFEFINNSKTRVSDITSLQKELEICLGYVVTLDRTSDKSNTLSATVNYKKPFWRLRQALSSDEYDKTTSELTIPYSMKSNGEKLFLDIKEAPHILVSGTTGAGKTVFLDDIILSILYRATPEQVQLVLIDIVGVNFTYYNGIPHLYQNQAITNRNIAVDTLYRIEYEMNERYNLFSSIGVKDIDSYNKHADEKLPRYVVIIDEFVELLSNNKEKSKKDDKEDIKDINRLIRKITAKARAAGIHLIIATQYDATAYISGTTKNNIPIQISFSTTNTSRFKGLVNRRKRKLLGNGDMEVSLIGRDIPIYGQAPYVSDDEVKCVVDNIKYLNKRKNK